MASIATSITIRDRLTARMNRIENAFNRAERAARALDTATERVNMTEAYAHTATATERAAREVEAFNRKQEYARTCAEGVGDEWGRVKGLVQTAAAVLGVSKLTELSDQVATIRARLDLMNDGLQTTAELQDRIMASANRSRASFLGTADAVSKMGVMAKDAFNSSAELIAFSELVNKQFAIAGTPAAGVDAATLQLTQAMASGVLRGEELNSVFEQAPTIIQTIAEYLDVPVGKIRDMAAEGQITATIVKSAMLDSADKINRRFNDMPMTWAQVWNRASNMALLALGPLLTGINWVANNIGIIAPLVLGVGAAFAVFQVAAHWTQIAAAATAVYDTVLTFLRIGFGVLAGKTNAAAAAQIRYNSALLASPVTWVVMAVAVLIALLYAGVAAFNKFTDSAVSATGIIGGAFAVLGAHIANTCLIPLWNGFAAVANFIGNVFDRPAEAAKVLFYDLATTVLGYIRNIATGIETLLNKIPGIQVDITSGLDALYGRLESASQAVKDRSEWVEYVQSKDFIDYGDAARAGYRFGKGLEDKVAGFFGFGDETGLPDLLADGIPSVGSVGEVGKINDDVNIADEDLKIMEDLATRRYETHVNSTSLVPQVSVKVEGGADRGTADDIAGRIAAILRREASSQTSISYAEV